MTERDTDWMRLALAQADLAAKAGEVPVGAVIVRDGELIAQGYNQPIGCHDPSAHAEIVAMRAAGQVLGNYRLNDCALYVTLEPCPMCIAAMVHARIARLVFGASDPKTGAVGGAADLLNLSVYNHKIAVTSGIVADDCSEMLRRFFRERR
ncbi:tRNA(adenine34) deaminase [Ectothiorhodosinus mongolicus]|uniref:tRNA-specific adenosine deaminase n=1 Tax=Ectothiorhodosinus mongolicus TaxID=233100 RepID=A0A1R3VR60_9GAMM|nr:tRNA adenosine(34) deaminase TadA [Ectothiorhodosinus mongolicus]ULX56474.1 tRNA adenosine(34) deaminase TadA [Ectothiorhodosinus mongolicus]SIT66052.1 tRNA(adenine34) deaminase [Ectothiorhodosinus mongolicus]